MINISPFAPKQFPDIAYIDGLKLVTLKSGERYKHRDDILLALMDEHTTSAAVFTQSVAPGAPVIWSRKVYAQGAGCALISSAGNANVCTGKQGQDNAEAMASATAKLSGLDAEQVYVASTGVIGEQLKVECIVDRLVETNINDEQDWHAAAAAIITTDTYPKAASQTIEVGDQRISISGIAKGSGMIEPNMATMLSYIFTDANISTECLQAMLCSVVTNTFNCITVDSDTSTSDTLLLFATGKAANTQISDIESKLAQKFCAALEFVMKDLARQVVKDGEGAQKFITIEVKGAESDQSAHIIAKSIANSPLVKTAIAGEDANWGRIVMAVGKAGQAIRFDAMSTTIGGTMIARGDGPLENYDEATVAKHLEGKEIDIAVDVGLGDEGSATVWTCDLTHAYIDINADYRS